ncbi:MAG: PTS sugar transporter subunit IIA [Deltaproteobacteria bacterium]|nr:PTS sugar transporter subunit IIA [Deltaproteobacteria bacterium]
MLLCHCLTPNLILCPMTGETKAKVLTTLAEHLTTAHDLKSSKKVLDAIMARERVGSTFLPIGVAVPHARYEGIEDVKMVLGVHPSGILEEFDGQPTRVHVVTLFLSPLAEADFGRHLKLLAWISTIFHTRDRVAEVASAPNPQSVFALLQRYEREAHEVQNCALREDSLHPPRP